ncbi:transposase [Streptomyces sp. NPDC090054]|uniref:transposase n=1 Tax=Streptomyces sp. NPDC090054 TaxID=3365933 RepID=UPI00380CC41E
MSIEPDDHGLGRSRGGLTTKIHLSTEQGQKPMSLLITAGHRHDSPYFQPVLEKVRVARPGPGRPRTRPTRVRGDKAYGSRANRAYLRKRRIVCTIPEKADQIHNRKKLGSHGGRPPAFDKEDHPIGGHAGSVTLAVAGGGASDTWRCSGTGTGRRLP